MRKRVTQLTLDELDFAVAKAEHLFYMRDTGGQVFGIQPDGKVAGKAAGDRMYLYNPTRDWRQAGPIIERLGISMQKMDLAWAADIGREAAATGATPLEAAMRTRVIAAFGHEVDLDLE